MIKLKKPPRFMG